jgi:hypothetical protein
MLDERRVQRKGAAERDIAEHFLYIGADSDDAALRFLAATERSFHELARKGPEQTVYVAGASQDSKTT